jgi:hypothetical protein
VEKEGLPSVIPPGELATLYTHLLI